MLLLGVPKGYQRVLGVPKGYSGLLSVQKGSWGLLGVWKGYLGPYLHYPSLLMSDLSVVNRSIIV
jgi:hypothetical protein